LRRRHDIVAVVTQPDRPAHRGQRVTPPPVKEAALAAGLAVLQPPRLRDPGWPERLAAHAADVAVVVAFGQILPKAVLDVPARGSINIHASLLPKYRGAAPIQWAIIRGETETGITTFKMDPGMDMGDVLLSHTIAIEPEETAAELAARLAALGAEVIVETLDRLDVLVPRPQDHGAATMAPRLTKADGVIDWSRPAGALVNLVRGCNPWPGATTTAPGGSMTLWRARAVGGAPRGMPGTLVPHDGALVVATGGGLLVPITVQPENRRAMSWADYLRGARLAEGVRLGVA
jgi:methionyl-tRNA formyltransferase